MLHISGEKTNRKKEEILVQAQINLCMEEPSVFLI